MLVYAILVLIFVKKCGAFRLSPMSRLSFARPALSDHIYGIAGPIFETLCYKYTGRQSAAYQQNRFANVATSTKQLTFDLDDTPFVACESATHCISQAMDDRRCGVSVLFAPAGSGKTTLLLQEALRRKREGEHIVYTTGLTDKAAFLELLDIKGSFIQVSDLVTKPKRTTLILDQVDEATVRSGLRALIQELAVDSTRHKTYTVVVAVSRISAAKTLIELNGHTKIRLVGKGNVFRWNKNQIDAYISECEQLKTLSVTDKCLLQKLALHAGTPVLLYHIASAVSPADELHSTDTVDLANELALQWASSVTTTARVHSLPDVAELAFE